MDALVDIPEAGADSGASWEQVKEIRQTKFAGSRPLLLLYPICRDSVPKRDGNRMALHAVIDILGVGIVFPKAPHDIPVGYKRAPIDVTRYEQAEYIEEVLPDDDTAVH
jgi:hypothetical protein